MRHQCNSIQSTVWFGVVEEFEYSLLNFVVDSGRHFFDLHGQFFVAFHSNLNDLVDSL